MSPHAELDQLSAYLDGELDAHERTTLEAHLPSCAECRSTLDALRATIADLASLPEPVPSEQDSWALRSSIARARVPVMRWHRVAWSAGAVAAAAVAVIVIVQMGGGDTLRTFQAREDSIGGGAGRSANIVYDAGAFSATSAQTKLLQLAGKISPGATVQAVAPAAEGAPAPNSGANQGLSSDTGTRFSTTGSDVSAEIDRCVSGIQRSTQQLLQPVEYDVGTYESKPAFLLFFRTSERYELWVVQRPSCDVLYFAQAA